MNIGFANTVLRTLSKDVPQIPQTQVRLSPLEDEDKVKAARAFLESRGIQDIKPLYNASEYSQSAKESKS